MRTLTVPNRHFKVHKHDVWIKNCRNVLCEFIGAMQISILVLGCYNVNVFLQSVLCDRFSLTLLAM